MTHRSLTVCALLTLATFARAELTCDKPEFDAGRVRGGTALVHRFTLVNSGKETVQIDEPKIGCGCLRASIERRSLEPGEGTSVSVEVHTVTQASGPNSWRVMIPYRNPSQQGGVVLQVKAEVTPELAIAPATMILSTDAPTVRPFTLTEHRAEPVAVRAASTSSHHVKVRLTEPAQQSNAWQRAMHLEIAPDCPDGRHDLVLMVYTNDERYPELKVPFSVVKRARGVQAMPASIEWKAQPASAGPLPSRIVLLDAGDENVRVERIESDHPALRCTFAAGPGPRSTLRIVCDTTPPAGLMTAVRVHLQDPKRTVLTIPVRIEP